MKYATVTMLLASLLCTTLSTTSCSYLQRRLFSKTKSAEKTEKKKELPPRYLGAVHQVYPEQRFALLRIIGPIPKPGATLISHPADGSTSRMGNLIVSEDNRSKGRIIAADIRSGVVESGDYIFLYRSIAPAAANLDEQPLDTSAAQNAPAAGPAAPAYAPAPELPLQNKPAVTDLQGDKPQPAGGVEVSVPAPSAPPQGARPLPNMPQLPEKAPAYLDSIPTDINQWD